MKIIYLLSWNDKNDIGVLNKINDQVNYWMKENNEVQPWIMCRDNFKGKLPVHLTNYKIYNQLNKKTFLPRQVERYIRQSFSAKKIAKDIKEFKPDLIYYRPSIWMPWLNNILKSAPVIMELNGLDTEEIKFSNIIRTLVYKSGRGKIIRHVNAFVAVTNEISRLYMPYKKQMAIIPNGININNISPVKKQPHQTPQVIFVGSPGMPWHGVDKIIMLAQKLPDISFHIVGPDLKDNNLENIHHHNFLYKEELSQLYNKMDIGISSLASYRRNMKEGCSLKIREYVAYGLPLILAYDDPDVPDHELILKIPNREDNIETHAEIIRQFIFNNYLKTLPENIRQRVNIEEKENQRLQFFSEVVQQQKKNIIN